MSDEIVKLGERLMRLETLQQTSEAQARAYRIEVRNDVKMINVKVDRIEDSLRSMVDQFKGGGKVIKSLWWLGGAALAAGVYISGKSLAIANLFR